MSTVSRLPLTLAGLSLVALAACDQPGAYDELSDEELAAATANLRTAMIDFGDGPIEIEFEDRDGVAIFEGDIELGATAEVEGRVLSMRPPAPEDPDGRLAASGLSHLNPWPGGRIPFLIDARLPAEVQSRIQTAVNDWNSQTIVRLVPKDPAVSEDHVMFTIKTASMGDGEGSSPIGAPVNPLAAEQNLIRLGNAVSVATIRHEIGHTVGLFHEQSRADRDLHVSINWDNIAAGKEGNFMTYLASGAVGLDFGPYDRNSLMHYRSFAFAADPTVPTIVRAGCNFSAADPACLFTPSATLTTLDRKGVTRQVSGDPLIKMRLRNEASGQCLRPQGGSTAVGAAVVLDSCTNVASKRWYEYRRAGTTVPMIINEASRLCLGRNGTGGLIQVHCTGAAAQRYNTVDAQDINPFTGNLLTVSGLCLTRLSTSAQPTHASSCPHSDPNRRWYKDL
jgi:hypothetical protein